MRAMLAVLPLLASVSMAQQPDHVTACSASATLPPCTLTFTMPTVTQVPPTTTFFDSIVTTILNIVDCQECTVVNVAPNDAPSTQVPFTTKTTQPVLTVVHAGCIPQTSVSTRGVDATSIEKTLQPSSTQAVNLKKRGLDAAFLPEIAATTYRRDHVAADAGAAFLPEIAATTYRRDHVVADAGAAFLPEIAAATTQTAKGEFVKRSTLTDELDKRIIQSEQELALDFTDLVDPGNWTVMQSIQEYRRQCYSAFVAVSLMISGADPQMLCTLTKTPELQLSMTKKGLDGTQVSDLICFWSVYGYHLNVSEFQVLDTLATAATSFSYAMQYGLNSTQDVVRLCNGLDLQDNLYQMLHIDSQGIYTILCSSAIASASASISSSTITSTVSQTASVSSGEVVWTSWGSNGSVLITVSAGGVSWGNPIGTGSATATFGGTGSISGGEITASGGWSSGWGINATAGATGVPWPTGGDGNATATLAGTAASGSWSAGSEVNGTGVVSGSWSAGWGISATGGASGSWSAGWGVNATGTAFGSEGSSTQPQATPFSTISNNGTIIVVGSGSGVEPTLSVTTFTDGNGSIIVSGTAAITAATPSWSLSNVTGTSSSAAGTGVSLPSSIVTNGTAAPGSSTSGPINATVLPTPTLSWTTFTDANGSVVVSGTGSAAASWTFNNGTVVVAPTVGVNASSWSSAGGNISVSVGSGETLTYTGVAWTSWIVSSRATAAIITGTSAAIPWGTASATAVITGSAQVAAFTVVVSVTKTIIVSATAFGQTWTGWGASGAITGVGTAGTWTLDQSFTNAGNATSVDATGSIITDTWNTTLAAPGPGTGGVTATSQGGMVPGGIPLGTAITATGLLNFTSTAISIETTSVSGNPTAVANVTHVTSGVANITTTIVGGDIPSGVATIGTGPVTTNTENITFSIISPSSVGTISVNGSEENATFSILPWTSSKFSYPAWTTSTSSSST